MDNPTSALLSPNEIEQAEMRTLAAAVAESLADPTPSIPHEMVLKEIVALADELERQIASAR